MKEYEVNIREYSEKVVIVHAETPEEAERIARDRWNDGEIELNSDDFKDVEFGTLAERELSKSLDCLLVEPGQVPQRVTIDNSLETLQKMVDGDIEVTYPFEEQVGLIMNEEGKMMGLPLNRPLYDSEGNIYDIIAGKFLVVGLTEDDFGSLTPEQMDKYEEMYHQPQAFIRMGKEFMAFPIPEDPLGKGTEKLAHDTMQKLHQAEVL